MKFWFEYVRDVLSPEDLKQYDIQDVIQHLIVKDMPFKFSYASSKGIFDLYPERFESIDGVLMLRCVGDVYVYCEDYRSCLSICYSIAEDEDLQKDLEEFIDVVPFVDITDSDFGKYSRQIEFVDGKYYLKYPDRYFTEKYLNGMYKERVRIA